MAVLFTVPILDPPTAPPSNAGWGTSAPLEPIVKLSTQLDAIAEGMSERAISFGDVVAVTHGRAYDFLLILLAVPFLSPFGSIPGVAAFMGAMMSLIGARLALGRKPWLPEAFMAKKLGPGIALKILRAGAGVMRRLEKLLRPRIEVLHSAIFFRRLTGVLICISGFLLFLPLPIPFSNFMPAFTVMLLAAGALERDGVFFLAGAVMFIVTIGFFVGIAVGGLEAFQWIRNLLPDWGGDPEAS